MKRILGNLRYDVSLIAIVTVCWFFNSARFPLNEGWVNIWVEQLKAGVNVVNDVYPFSPGSFYVYFFLSELADNIGLGEFTVYRIAGWVVISGAILTIYRIYWAAFHEKILALLAAIYLIFALFSSTTIISYDYMMLYIWVILVGILFVQTSHKKYGLQKINEKKVTEIEKAGSPKNLVWLGLIMLILCLLKQSTLIGMLFVGIFLIAVLFVRPRLPKNSQLQWDRQYCSGILAAIIGASMIFLLITSVPLSNYLVDMYTGKVGEIHSLINPLSLSFMDMGYKGGLKSILSRFVLTYIPMSKNSIIYTILGFTVISCSYISLSGNYAKIKMKILDPFWETINIYTERIAILMLLALSILIVIRFEQTMTGITYITRYSTLGYIAFFPFFTKLPNKIESRKALDMSIILFIFQCQDIASAGLSYQGYASIITIAVFPVYINTVRRAHRKHIFAPGIKIVSPEIN